MKTEDFDYIANILKQKSGLVLNSDKMYLLESRLNPLARKLNFATLDDMIMALKMNNDVLKKQVIDAMTTNESFFFRDTKPFDMFRNFVLPYLLKTRAATKKIRIWSAACSSGQEPYSLCMILKDFAKELEGWTIEIVGTDLSTEILEKAKRGTYTQFEVQRGLPIQFLVEHFSKQGEGWQINQEIRNMVEYKEVNLLEDFTSLGVFDVIFCRNVLIYFDKEDKTKVLDKISRVSSQDCFLFLGGAETVFGSTEKFKLITGIRGVYVSSSVDDATFADITGHSTEKSKEFRPAQPVNSVFSRPALSTAPTKPVLPSSTPNSVPAKPVLTTIPPVTSQTQQSQEVRPAQPVYQTSLSEAKPASQPVAPQPVASQPPITQPSAGPNQNPNPNPVHQPQRPIGTVQSASSILNKTGSLQSASTVLHKEQSQQPGQDQPKQTVSLSSILQKTQSTAPVSSQTTVSSTSVPPTDQAQAPQTNENKE